MTFDPFLGLPNYNYPASGYLIGSISGSDGISMLRVDMPDAVAGQKVRIAIETVGQVDPANFNPVDPRDTPSNPSAGFLRFSRFEFPTTPKANQVTVEITL